MTPGQNLLSPSALQRAPQGYRMYICGAEPLPAKFARGSIPTTCQAAWGLSTAVCVAALHSPPTASPCQPVAQVVRMLASAGPWRSTQVLKKLHALET